MKKIWNKIIKSMSPGASKESAWLTVLSLYLQRTLCWRPRSTRCTCSSSRRLPRARRCRLRTRRLMNRWSSPLPTPRSRETRRRERTRISRDTCSSLKAKVRLWDSRPWATSHTGSATPRTITTRTIWVRQSWAAPATQSPPGAAARC